MINSKDVTVFVSTSIAVIVEEFVNHPIGGIVAILGLLYSFEKYRTQRLERKIKEKEYEDKND